MMFYRDLPRSRNRFHEHSSNALRELEVLLQQKLIALGRQDMAEAVANGRKYHRLEQALSGILPPYKGAVGLRRAFDPKASVPRSKEAWIAEAMIKFADDEGLKVVVAEWAVEKKRIVAEAAAKAAAEAQATPKAGAATAAAEGEVGDQATAAVKTAGEKVEDTVTGSEMAKQSISETTAVEEGGGDKSMASNQSEQKAVAKLAEAAAPATIGDDAPNVAEA